jgi:hypothetical protein
MSFGGGEPLNSPAFTDHY